MAVLTLPKKEIVIRTALNRKERRRRLSHLRRGDPDSQQSYPQNYKAAKDATAGKDHKPIVRQVQDSPRQENNKQKRL
jgi:hypothetical protein